MRAGGGDYASVRGGRVGGYREGMGEIQGAGGVDEGRWREDRGWRKRWERDEYLASPLQSRSLFVPGNPPPLLPHLTGAVSDCVVVERTGTLLERLRGEVY